MSGRAGKLDFTNDLALEIGATFDGSITLTNDNDSPVNLTGFSVLWQVRASAASSTVILDISEHCTSATPTNGVIAFSVPPSVTKLLTKAKCVTDLFLVQGDYARRELVGEFHIVETVSREVS
jgi:hypothetical protein